jgi:nicotinate-nucleotide adenylyltransferase
MSVIVVVGGAFNPLSKAHGEMMRSAKKAAGADRVVIVPAADRFLRSWKKFDDGSIVPVEAREEALAEFCRRNPWASVSDIETSGRSRSTYDTLSAIRAENPGDRIILAFGTDKLSELSRWHEWQKLLGEFEFEVIRRDEDDVGSILAGCQFLGPYLRNFRFYKRKARYACVSSTKIREALAAGDIAAAKKMTYRYVIDALKESGAIK